MNKDWIPNILGDFLPSEIIEDLQIDFENKKNLSLSQIGVESLAIMGIVINIEEKYNKEIDFETFDVSQIENLTAIEKFINS